MSRVPCCTTPSSSPRAWCDWRPRARITAVDGTEIEVRADSICTHGDSPGAVEMARAVRTALTGAGIEIAPFVR